jgi:predicted regulator of Ras-like GTPase activity (Roadblock/LC7/MglB family)
MASLHSSQGRQRRGVALTDMLEALVNASSDFEGAVLVSKEGLVIAAAWPLDDQDDSDVGAVATRAFELSARAMSSLERGGLRRLILLGSEGNLVISEAGPDALCVVLLRPDAKIGVASFEAARISEQIAQVLG